VTPSSSTPPAAAWLDVLTVLVILGLIAFEVIARTGRPSVMVSLAGLILSLATRRHDRASRSDAPPAPTQEADTQ
jgi:hypothetical protein